MTSPVAADAKRVRGLRANTFAAIVILLMEYGLGMWVNLYGHLPSTDRGAGLAGGFARMSMAAAAGVAIAVYSLTLFLTANSPIGQAAPEHR